MSDDEMSFQEAWETLAKYRWVAIISFLAVVLAAGFYLARAKPTYEVEGSFYIGLVREIPIEPPTLVAQRLEATFRKERAIPGALLATVTPDRRDGRLIRFTVRGTSPLAVQTLADEMVASVVEAHTKRAAKRNDALTSELRELRNLGEEGHAAMERLKRQSHAGSEVSNALMYSTIELAVIRMRIGELEQQLRDGFEPTEVVARPIVGKTPISPNKRLVAVLALMGGILMALVVPFFAKAVAKRRSA